MVQLSLTKVGQLVFALPIAKYTEGTYHVVNLTTDSDQVGEFDRC